MPGTDSAGGVSGGRLVDSNLSNHPRIPAMRGAQRDLRVVLDTTHRCRKWIPFGYTLVHPDANSITSVVAPHAEIDDEEYERRRERPSPEE